MKKQCEICNKKMSLDKHHIQSKVYGGSNDNYNIANLCPNCHRLVHKGLIILEGKYGTTNGIRLIWRKYGEESVTGNSDPKVYLHKDYKLYQERIRK